jgi:ribosomal protein S18 acetylase RimI-like enzyme
MNRTFAVTALGSSDLARMRQMLALLGEAFDDRETYCGRQPDDGYLSSLLSDWNFIALAAVEGESVLGGLAGYVLRKFEQCRSEFYIYDLAVARSHRRRGVATAMIRKLQDIAAERGIYVIFVQADYGDDPAIALYSKLGAREQVLHFDIDPHVGD